MPVVELMYIAIAMLGLAILRFGVPMLLTWIVSRVLGVFAHPAS